MQNTSALGPRSASGMLSVLLLSGCLADHVYDQLRQPRTELAQVPQGVGSLSAQVCGGCHATIYEEWAASNMGRAFTNPIFQADWEQYGQLETCLACHAPLQEQQQFVTTGLESLKPFALSKEDNPHYQPALQQEGVTCVVCHLEEGTLVGPHADVNAPHPTRTRTLSPDLCEGCHQLEEPPLHHLKRPISDTHREWEAWKQATGRQEDCADCHMPAVTRPLVVGGVARPSHQHTFPGSWDDALLKSSLLMQAPTRDGRDASVALENLAGHGLPTTEPSHVLRVRLALVDAQGDETAYRTFDLSRIIERNIERSDTTLKPAERRTLSARFSRSQWDQAHALVATATFNRLERLTPVLDAAQVPLERRSLILAQHTTSLK